MSAANNCGAQFYTYQLRPEGKAPLSCQYSTALICALCGNGFAAYQLLFRQLTLQAEELINV